MLASITALRDLLVAHLMDSVQIGNEDRKERQRSVLASAQSLLSDVHYGGRVKSSSDQHVLASMLRWAVLPVLECLLEVKEDAKDKAAAAEGHSIAKVALSFDADRHKTIPQILEAVSAMPGLDSTLELLGIDAQTAAVCWEKACLSPEDILLFPLTSRSMKDNNACLSVHKPTSASRHRQRRDLSQQQNHAGSPRMRA